MTELETISATVLLHPSLYLQFSVHFSFTYNVWTRDFQITAASPMIIVAKFLVNGSSIYPSPLLYAAMRNGGSLFFGNRSGLLWKAQSPQPYHLSFYAIRVNKNNNSYNSFVNRIQGPLSLKRSPRPRKAQKSSMMNERVARRGRWQAFFSP